MFLEEKKINSNELKKLQYIVESLMRALPTVQGQIDQSYYSCESIEDFSSQTENTALVYYIGNKSFKRYLENSYRGLAEEIKLGSLSGTVAVTPVTILDSSWIAAFGGPY